MATLCVNCRLGVGKTDKHFVNHHAPIFISLQDEALTKIDGVRIGIINVCGLPMT